VGPVSRRLEPRPPLISLLGNTNPRRLHSADDLRPSSDYCPIGWSVGMVCYPAEWAGRRILGIVSPWKMPGFGVLYWT